MMEESDPNTSFTTSLVDLLTGSNDEKSSPTGYYVYVHNPT